MNPAETALGPKFTLHQIKSTRNSKREQSAPRYVRLRQDIAHVATMELFNTLGGKIEPLTPVGAPALRMYCCGPTVYDYGHIGNFRTFLHVDVLRRFMRQQGMAIDYVMNVTDVENRTAQPLGIVNFKLARRRFDHPHIAYLPALFSVETGAV